MLSDFRISDRALHLLWLKRFLLHVTKTTQTNRIIGHLNFTELHSARRQPN